MNSQLLPFIYAALVFSVIAFLFVLLGRIFLNIDTIYNYGFEVLMKKDNFLFQIEQKITERGKRGWRYVRSEEYLELGTSTPMILLLFEKTKNKVKFL
jgi:hypothetical protein